MKKILFINSTMNIGGIESFLMSVLRAIDLEKYKPIFLTYSTRRFDYEDQIISYGGRILRISDPKTVSKLRHIREIVSVLKDESIDVIHVNTYFNSLYVLIASLIAGGHRKYKTIIHSHTARALTERRLEKKLEHSLGRFLMGMFTAERIACSNEAGRALFGRKKFTLIQNGIDFKKYQFNKTSRNIIRRELTIPDDSIVIGHVGRFDYPKNHLFLLDVFAEYVKQQPNSRLILVGSGLLRESIKRRISDLGLNDFIILTGDRSDVYKVINAFDLVLFPSIYEGLPVALVEAQVNGIPTLISDAISSEVALTNCITFKSLADPPAEWAKQLLSTDKRRIDTSDRLDGSGYSIDETVKKLDEIYSAIEVKNS